MKANKSTTANGHWRGRTRHEVMIAATVIRVLVADGADHAELVKALRQQWHRLAEMHTRHAGRDRLELAANLLRCARLRVKGLVMRRPAIQPHQNAVDLIRARLATRLRGLRSQRENVRKTHATQRPQTELEEIAATDTVAVGVKQGHVKRSRGIRGWIDFSCGGTQWLNTNSAELISAQARSSVAV